MEAGETAAGLPERRAAVQLGFLWGAAALSAAALGLAAPGLVSRFASALLPCPMKALAGIPCPACGSGRAALALTRLDLSTAFVSNPLFSLAALLFVAGGFVAAVWAFSGRGVPEPRTLSVAARVGLVTAVAVNWAWVFLDGR